MLQLLQLFQPIQRLMQRLILLRKMEADQVVHILAEEAGAGHGAYAHIPGQHLAEFQVALVAVAGNVHQHVVRALGRGVLQPDGIVRYLNFRKPREDGNKKLNILRFLGNNPLFVNKLSKYGVGFSSFRQF